MKVVKTCDLSGEVAGKLFEMLNYGEVQYHREGTWKYIVTDVEPSKLCYPEGWYYGKGCLRNKHTSTNGVYSEIDMMTSDGRMWEDIATYCTLQSA